MQPTVGQGAPIVTIFGGSGFVGRYIARRMAKAGWRVRVACRRPNEALFVRTYGAVGQVEPVLANIRYPASVAEVCENAAAVVNCVGILAASGAQSFDAVQDEGAGTVAAAAAAAGACTFVQLSAIGADAGSDSAYARTKALGEAKVLAAMPDAVILRPSIVFGPEDEFFNRFGAMARIAPIVPVIGPETRFQPVYVDDVAAAAEAALTGKAAPGIYELGGPDVESFRALMARMLAEIRRRRLVAAVPFWAAALQGRLFDTLSGLTGGLLPAPVTADQVKLLRRDNVVSEGAKGFAELGITPTDMAAVLPEYLWRYRPHGQFKEIMESADGLKER